MSSTRWIAFAAIMFTTFGIACTYLGFKFMQHSQWAARHRELVFGGVAAFVVFEIASMIARRKLHGMPLAGHAAQWVANVGMGAFACLFFYSLFVDILLRAARWGLVLVGTAPPPSLDRRSFMAVLGASAGSLAIGTAQAAQGPKLYEVEVPVAGLAPELRGFKIAQISDLHVGLTIGRKYVGRVVERVNALDADLIALTGDFVDGDVGELGPDLEPLRGLKSRHGMFFTTGNHEYYSGVAQWLEYFRGIGAKVLVNQHEVVEVAGAKLAVGGIPDEQGGMFSPAHVPDARKAFAGAPEGAFRLLLAHRPSQYQEAVAAGARLQLSGHTHGGQFYPWAVLVALTQKYYKGLYRHDDRLWVYTSRGTGYWGPPVRFGVPSEITLLKLIPT